MQLIFSKISAKKRSMLWLVSLNCCSSASKYFLNTYRRYRNEEICKKDDFVDFFGIICQGSAFISFESANSKNLGIGTMIGHMNFAELSYKEKHAVTVIAKTDGLIAVIPYGEEKMEFRRNPV